MGFPDSSVGKESACNVGDADSILGLEDLPRKGTGYPLQYSRASPGPPWVKNPPAMRETCVRPLGGEDSPQRKGKGYPLQYSGLEN